MKKDWDEKETAPTDNLPQDGRKFGNLSYVCVCESSDTNAFRLTNRR